MALLGSALALVPRFNGSNMPLTEWEERLDYPARLYQVPAWLIAELAINSLKDDTQLVLMALPEEDRVRLERIMTHLEGLFRENMTVPKLRCRFFVRRQQQDRSLTHFAVVLQHL